VTACGSVSRVATPSSDPAECGEEFPLPRALAKAFKATRAHMQRRLEPLGLHAGQDYLLDLLDAEGEMTIGALAERLGVEIPTVVRTVQRMGPLIERTRDPDDRRRTRIALSERGREVVPAVREVISSVTAEATAGFTAAERAQLIELLRRAMANLSDEDS
jgi:MarR family transcriptional regulator, transcriptional regulator for hemolysin